MTFEKSLNREGIDEHLKDYLFGHIAYTKYDINDKNHNYTEEELEEIARNKTREERLEEFLVESLTNRELAGYLNTVDATAPTEKTKKSIFDKILELLSDIFGWNIAEGKLYEKELKVLQGFTSEKVSNEQTASQLETLNNLNNYIDYTKQHITFDKDTHTYYVDDEPADYSVTQYAGEIYGKPNIEGDYSHSSAIGTSMDTMYRDFFIHGDEVVNINYPNLNEARKKQILEDLHRLRSYLDNRFGKGAYTVITDEFPLAVNAKTENGNKVIVGTMDMLIMDKDGNFHIFDFKAKNHPIDRKINGKEGDDRRNYTAQQNMYREMLETINPAFKDKVKSIQLIWMDTFYPSIRDVKYITDDNGQVTVDGTPIENYTGFGTPHLKENIEDSIISLEMTDNIEGLQIPEMRSLNEPFADKVIEEPKEEKKSKRRFGRGDRVGSSVKESITPSVSQFVETLSLEERVNFNKLLLDGTFSMKCS